MPDHLVTAPSAASIDFSALPTPAIRSSLQGKIDRSGIVQESLLSVHQAGDKFPAGDPRQRRAWLTKVYRNHLTDAIRKAFSKKRDVRREVAINAPIGTGEAQLADILPAEVSTPSQRAVRSEEADRLERALSALRPHQREAVELHYLKGLSVGQIADAMGKSKTAVAGLLKRGLEELRGRLADPKKSA